MANDKVSGGNITLIKNAPRNKDGKRKGNFSQVDHSINALAAEIGLDGYGIYHFLLNNAEGNFWYSSTTLSSIFKSDNLSKSRINRAINALVATGLLEREKIGQKGKRPLYGYRIYEISTKQQPAIAHVIDTPKQELSEIPQQPMPSQPQIDLSIPAISHMDDFSVTAKSVPSNIINTNDFKQHIFDICQREGAFSDIVKDKVLKCCRRYYAEHKSKPNDTAIALFANYLSADSTQNPMNVYEQLVVM